jgi:hypothetical protein
MSKNQPNPTIYLKERQPAAIPSLTAAQLGRHGFERLRLRPRRTSLNVRSACRNETSSSSALPGVDEDVSLRWYPRGLGRGDLPAAQRGPREAGRPLRDAYVPGQKDGRAQDRSAVRGRRIPTHQAEGPGRSDDPLVQRRGGNRPLPLGRFPPAGATPAPATAQIESERRSLKRLPFGSMPIDRCHRRGGYGRTGCKVLSARNLRSLSEIGQIWR